MKAVESRLGRRLGLLQTTAVALGAMIGAGVYVSMAEAAATTGASLFVAVVLGALVATLNGLSSAELGAFDPCAGGAYQFARRLVSPGVGFLAGWVFLWAAIAAGATFALTFAAYLQPLAPGIPPRMAGLAVALAAVALNAAGVRLSSRVNVAVVAANVLVLLAFVALAAPSFDARRLQPVWTGGPVGLLQAGALLFFAFTGYARPVTVAEEVIDPRHTLPRAIPTALAITLALYLLVAGAALGAVGPVTLGGESAPLRAVMTSVGSGPGATLVSLGALLASGGVVLTEIWGLSRLAFAMARNGDLPTWLGVLQGDRIPRNAVLATGGALVLLSGLLDLRPALEASSLGLLIYYGIMNLSALRLPPEHRLYPALVPAAGLLACALVALSLPPRTLLAVGAVAVVGATYYAWWRGR